MSIFEHSNYRAFLKAAYVARSERNPSFSLRAFAKLLGLSPAAVTRVFSGEKNLSVERAGEIGQALRLSAAEIEYLCLLVQLETTRVPALRAALLDRVSALRPQGPVHDLSVDYFKVIADWYHLAILEAIQIKDIEFTPRSLAEFLGISPVEAELAIERLRRLELIEIRADGRPARLANRLLVGSRLPNEAMRKHYRQMLARAEEAVDAQGPSEKVIGTETFAFDRAQLERARKLTDEYLDGMLRLAKSGSRRRDVYQVAVQFFRLNRERKETGERK